MYTIIHYMQTLRNVAVQTQEEHCSKCIHLEQIVTELYQLKLQELAKLQTAMQMFKKIKREASLNKQCQPVVQEVQTEAPHQQLKFRERQSERQQMKPNTRQSKAASQKSQSEQQKREMERQVIEKSMTEIILLNQESFLENERSQIISLVNDIQHNNSEGMELQEKYHFIVKASPDNKYFILDNNTITKDHQPKSNLRRIVAIQPISKTKPQMLSFKVLKSTNFYIYFGVLTEQQTKQQVRVYPRNNSAITYLARGGKHLYVLNKNQEQRMPQIEQNSVISFVVNYSAGVIEWYKDQLKIHTTHGIDFQAKTWYPYVAFRDSYDSVLLL